MSGAVIAALMRYLGPVDGMRSMSTRWASSSLTGRRHWIEGVVRADAPVDTLAEADLALDNGFVAGVAVRRCGTAAGGLRIALDVLTIDE